jgi:hypothetical protein
LDIFYFHAASCGELDPAEVKLIHFDIRYYS